MTFLTVNEIDVYHGESQALTKVSLDVAPGEWVAIFGPNGAGKSTLVNALAGLLNISNGIVTFEGEPIHGLPPNERVQRGIVLVPEGKQLFPTLTVRENLKVGSYSSDKARKGLKENMKMVFKHFPQLEPLINEKARTLSGGEAQMLAVGRGLMAIPRLLMLDEPLLGLAPKTSLDLLADLRDIAKQGISILLVEQSLDTTLGFVDRAYILESGKFVAHDTASNLLSNDEIKKKYFGY